MLLYKVYRGAILQALTTATVGENMSIGIVLRNWT